MAARYSRHLKREIDSGKVELPDDLKFLTKINYFAVTEQRVDGVREWCIEIPGFALKALLDMKRKLDAARLSKRKIRAENRELINKASSIEKELADLEDSNRQLKSNLDGDGKFESERLLLDARKKLDAAQLSDLAYNAQIRELKTTVSSLEDKVAKLEAVNEQLLANMDDDSKAKSYEGGPKNIFQIVDEDPTRRPSRPPYPHGFASKKKRR